MYFQVFLLNLGVAYSYTMKRIVFPFDVKKHRRSLTFFLATEEWVALNLYADSWIFTWIVEPTVICGHHQEIPLEVNLEYCRTNNINVVRRRSGGGCVYADKNNIMISHVCPLAGRSYETIFSEFTHHIVRQLHSINIKAQASGRNDIMVNGRKISGGAFYRFRNCAISHGTMLFNVDNETMRQTLTPARAKLHSKGIKSVASRVTTIHNERPELSFDEFHRKLTDGLTDGEYHLTPDDIAAIEQIETHYLKDEWLRIKPELTQGSTRASQHFAGEGTITTQISLDASGIIRDISFSSDLMNEFPSKLLAQQLIGHRAEYSELTSLLNQSAIAEFANIPPPHKLAQFITKAARRHLQRKS